MTVQAWVRREISRGLQGLIALRLPGAPGEDTVSMTLDVWLIAIAPRAAGWKDSDAPRVQSGFQTLFGQCRQWPVPADLLNAIPAPIPPKLLAAPEISAEERARNSARMSTLIDQIFQKHRM